MNPWIPYVLLIAFLAYMLVTTIVRDILKVRAWRRRQGPRP